MKVLVELADLEFLLGLAQRFQSDAKAFGGLAERLRATCEQPEEKPQFAPPPQPVEARSFRLQSAPWDGGSGVNKIQGIKAIREAGILGLKAAKEFAEASPDKRELTFAAPELAGHAAVRLAALGCTIVWLVH